MHQGFLADLALPDSLDLPVPLPHAAVRDPYRKQSDYEKCPAGATDHICIRVETVICLREFLGVSFYLRGN